MQRKTFSGGSPSGIKDHEIDRLNPAYINLTDTKEFKPLQDVTYLWVYTTDPEKPEADEIVIGIEEPWQYPQAFHAEKNEELLATLNQIKGDLVSGFGHPTLAVKFIQDGRAKDGQAYIAGELFYDKDENVWVINNKSGRFHTIQNDPEIIKDLMYAVADKFKEVNLSVQIKILTPPLFNPPQMWKKAEKHAKDRWNSKSVENIQLEALRIIVKHSNNIGISDLFKKRLHSISEQLKSQAKAVKGDLKQQEVENFNSTFQTLVDELQILASEPNYLSDLDKRVLTAIQDQITFIHSQMTPSNDNDRKGQKNF